MKKIELRTMKRIKYEITKNLIDNNGNKKHTPPTWCRSRDYFYSRKKESLYATLGNIVNYDYINKLGVIAYL